MSIIINLGTYISGGDTVFYGKVKTTYLGNRARVLKHLLGRMIFCPFERCFHKGSLWRGHRAVISFILTKKKNDFSVMGIGFITDIYEPNSTKYLDDNGIGVKPRQIFSKN